MGAKRALIGCNISKVYKQQILLMYDLQNIVAALKMPQHDKDKFYASYREKILKGCGENLKGKRIGGRFVSH